MVKLSYMLDTNMVSYIVRGQSQEARSRLLHLERDAVACISVITEAEILYGLAKIPEATKLKSLMEAFLASIVVLPWGRDEAEAYGLLRAKLEAAGKTLGNMDMMIAAHSMTASAILVTNDAAFQQVDDLHATVNWATDI